MTSIVRLGKMARMAAAAAVLTSLFAVAPAQEGYVGVRVGGDGVSCGAVVLKWPLDQPRQDYVPMALPVIEVPEAPAPAVAAASAAVVLNEPPAVEPIINGPATELAETTPIPVIHQHPALNAGTLYFPPADGYYRHYFPELGQSPYTWRADKGQYEDYLRHTFPYYQNVPPGVVQAVVPAAPAVAFQPAPVRQTPLVVPVGAPSEVVPPASVHMVRAGYPNNVWVAPAAVQAIAAPRAITAIAPVVVPESAPSPSPVVADVPAGQCGSCQ